MLSRVCTGSLYGLETKMVYVETDLSKGLPTTLMVGLPDVTVKESKERIRNAIINSGFLFPMKRVTINLSPANTRKEGSHFDLPIAVGVLAAIGEIKGEEMGEYAFMGELSLNGDIFRIDGVLPLIMGLKACGVNKFIIPEGNMGEAGLVKNVEIFPVRNLTEIVKHFNKEKTIKKLSYKEKMVTKIPSYNIDYLDVEGQENVKRAVTIACAGGHGLLLRGIPGTGKSMIAKRIPTIMPEMSYEERLQVTKIYSIGGELSAEIPIICNRPFRSPHHTISGVALIGGGIKPRPGELSYAHCGVLFLDEIAEFNKGNLEMLRQPLEDKKINIARSSGVVSFPCDVMLVATSNPCPCGYFGSENHECTCSQWQINNYRSKISGPLLDRFDLHVDVQPPSYKDIEPKTKKGIGSSQMKAIVDLARNRQKNRYIKENIFLNSQLSTTQIKKYCKLNSESKELLGNAFQAMSLSTRAYHKILKVARTISDMEESKEIQSNHVAEALSYRTSYGSKYSFV